MATRGKRYTFDIIPMSKKYDDGQAVVFVLRKNTNGIPAGRYPAKVDGKATAEWIAGAVLEMEYNGKKIRFWAMDSNILEAEGVR